MSFLTNKVVAQACVTYDEGILQILGVASRGTPKFVRLQRQWLACWNFGTTCAIVSDGAVVLMFKDPTSSNTPDVS